jgi:phage terminase small subunit
MAMADIDQLLPANARKRDDGLNLNPRQMAFVRHYLDTLNATDAARKAGYSAKSASEHGCELLRNPKIQQAIEREVAKSVPLLRAKIIEESAALAFANMADYVEFDQGGHSVDEDGTTVVSEHAQVRIKQSKQLTRRQLTAIKKISERVSSTGARQVDFELHGKDASLDRLAKILNLLPREGGLLLGEDREIREIRVTYADAPASVPLKSEER